MRLLRPTLFLVLSASIGLAVACLPDLAPFTVDQPGIESGVTFTGCGDGIIATLDDGGDSGETCDPGRVEGGVGADIPGCVSCQVTCEGQLDPKTNHCYFVVGSDVAINDAQERCGRAGAHLVTFASPREADFVNHMLPDAGPNGFWVGLARSKDAYGSDHPEEPGYPIPPVGPCSGCFGIGVIDGGDAGGTFPLEDASATQQEACLVSHGAGWLEASCRGEPGAAAHTTICEREPAGLRVGTCIGVSCVNIPFTAGQKQYVVVTQSAGPDQAAQGCVDLGGILVVLETAEEREELAHEVGQQLADPNGAQIELQVWAGVTNDGGNWTWEDGVPIDDGGRPSPWGNAQPEQSLAGDRGFLRFTSPAYDVQLAYTDNRLKVARAYVCQRAP